MAGFPSDRNHLRAITMSKLDLIILSYHEFNEEFSEYPFSRMYCQFREDIETKTYDLITIDDAHQSCLKAFEMLKDRNIRGMLFVPTSLIDQEGYLTWPQVVRVSEHHQIGNHSHNHINLQTLKADEVKEEIITANLFIEKHTGKRPRFFVPPFNKYNNHIDNLAAKFGLQIIKNRVDILNTTP